MIRTFLLASFLTLVSVGSSCAQPDTVKVGSYLISVHDINFREKEYTARFWLWFIYDNPDFDFSTQLDIPNAKTIDPPEIIMDSIEGRSWAIMKMKATMKEKWNVRDFPFDQQHLKIQIENTLFDNNSLVFKPDIKGSQYDSEDALDGWVVSGFKVSTINNLYETGFGDSAPGRDKQTFSAFLIELDLHRDALGLFMKIFLGMYIAFLIAVISFTPQPWELEPRFGLPVGGLFAAVGNKYIIDSLLPETSAFTLVDTLHTITFLGIFSTLVVSAICLKLYDNDKKELCLKVNRVGSRVVVALYIIANIFFIGMAVLL
ncbi:MAG TPA: hypothetical protein VFE57_13245 [Cyclobacteriaceae bacterium]|nr:hypothetical protein [Cyclobacteriaceae bacterium]